MPKVLNKHYQGSSPEPENSVYVGRPSKWGNPFEIGECCTREDAVRLYGEWLNNQQELLDSLSELKGKNLICWCSPKACHADILLDRANGNL
jgi:hypothetical protein